MIILGNYCTRAISKMLPFSFLLQGATSFLYFFALSWEHILVIRLSQGIWAGMAWLTAQTLLASDSQKISVGKHFGFFYAASNFGFISGSALCGLLFKVLDQYKLIFFFIAVFYVVSSLVSLLLKADVTLVARPRIQRNIKRNYEILFISIVHNGSVAFLTSIILIFAYEFLGFNVADMAGIVMVAGVLGVISRPVVGYLSDRFNELHIMTFGFLFRMVSFLLIIRFSSLQVLLFAAIFFTLATASVGTPLFSFVSRRTKKEELSSVLSLVNVSGDFGRILLPFCAAPESSRKPHLKKERSHSLYLPQTSNTSFI